MTSVLLSVVLAALSSACLTEGRWKNEKQKDRKKNKKKQHLSESVSPQKTSKNKQLKCRCVLRYIQPGFLFFFGYPPQLCQQTNQPRRFFPTKRCCFPTWGSPRTPAGPVPASPHPGTPASAADRRWTQADGWGEPHRPGDGVVADGPTDVLIQ